MPFRCTTCGQEHDELPDIGADKPDHLLGAPEEEYGKRIHLTGDTCVLDDDCFIRGVLLIPVHEQAEPFGFGVWVSQNRKNFDTYLANFDTPEIGPFFGWLCTNVAYYPERSLGLKTQAHFRGNGLRPTIELYPSDHQLAIDQREGITLAKAWEIVHHYMR
jgi:hypothetical protein